MALAEYSKRLSAYSDVSILEVPDEATPEHLSAAQKREVLDIEGHRILKQLRPRDGVIALDLSGRELSSEEWSQQFTHLQGQGYGRLAFILGGSWGLSEEVLHRADLRWSLGRLTFPHQLARILVLEQLYRGFRIARREPYHK